jgi:hypothetical protein
MEGLQAQVIAYLESKGWYFDWDHINDAWDHDHVDEYGRPSLNRRPEAIRTLHGWTLPQWGEYWSSDHLPPKGPKPKRRRHENLQDALWSQLLREEEPERYGAFFDDPKR